MTINVIDIVLILAFLAIVGIGYLSGVIRVVFFIIALYFGVIVATTFYVPLGQGMAGTIAALEIFTATLFAFFLLAILTTTAVCFSLIKTLPTLRLPRLLAGFDQVGGSALGMVAATFASVVTVVVLNFFFGLVVRTAAGGVEVSPLFLKVATDLRSSYLATYFVTLARPIFILMLPWFPGGLPAILTDVVKE